MPKWLRVWLIGFVVFLFVHWLFGVLSSHNRTDPYYALWPSVFGAFAFGGVLSWLQTVGRRTKPPQDADTEAGGPPV